MTSFGAPPLLLLTAEAAEGMASSGADWGLFDLRFDRTEGLAVVSGVSKRGDQLRLPAESRWMADHYLRHAAVVSWVGVWYRAEVGLFEQHQSALVRAQTVPTPEVRAAVRNGWKMPPVDRPMPVLTWVPDVNGIPVWSAWWIGREEARPGLVEVVVDAPPLSFLHDAWPTRELASVSAVVIGVGSIGSVVAETLADYALGRLVLVDHDRLLQHNVVRHRLGVSDLGRLKVHAMRDLLERRYPGLSVDAYPANIIYEADLLRSLLVDAQVVVGATDGVASRRVVNHLALRAGVPAILACVLENGAIGEIIRVRPGVGCLLCYRTRLEAEGTLDPEPGLDQDYGLGSPHLPMTAVAGDLAAVGVLAAKAAVATVLEQRGRWEQRLPGDVAIVGLQPVPNLTPPFDVERAAEVRWTNIGPVDPNCPSCAVP